MNTKHLALAALICVATNFSSPRHIIGAAILVWSLPYLAAAIAKILAHRGSVAVVSQEQAQILRSAPNAVIALLDSLRGNTGGKSLYRARYRAHRAAAASAAMILQTRRRLGLSTTTTGLAAASLYGARSIPRAAIWAIIFAVAKMILSLLF